MSVAAAVEATALHGRPRAAGAPRGGCFPEPPRCVFQGARGGGRRAAGHPAGSAAGYPGATAWGRRRPAPAGSRRPGRGRGAAVGTAGFFIARACVCPLGVRPNWCAPLAPRPPAGAAVSLARVSPLRAAAVSVQRVWAPATRPLVGWWSGLSRGLPAATDLRGRLLRRCTAPCAAVRLGVGGGGAAQRGSRAPRLRRKTGGKRRKWRAPRRACLCADGTAHQWRGGQHVSRALSGGGVGGVGGCPPAVIHKWSLCSLRWRRCHEVTCGGQCAVCRGQRAPRRSLILYCPAMVACVVTARRKKRHKTQQKRLACMRDCAPPGQARPIILDSGAATATARWVVVPIEQPAPSAQRGRPSGLFNRAHSRSRTVCSQR